MSQIEVRWGKSTRQTMVSAKFEGGEDLRAEVFVTPGWNPEGESKGQSQAAREMRVILDLRVGHYDDPAGLRLLLGGDGYYGERVLDQLLDVVTRGRDELHALLVTAGEVKP